jgi:hypothetical protein
MAVRVNLGTDALGGLNSSLPTQASKEARLGQRVITSTSSPSSDLRTSMEAKPGKLWTCPRLSANCSTI